MPRRKQLTFHIQDLRCAGHIIEEFDILIDRLQRGFSANKHTVTQLNGCYLITNVHLAKWMKTTQASVNKWIKDGLIKPSKKSFTNLEFFDIDEVIDQLRKQKQ